MSHTIKGFLYSHMDYGASALENLLSGPEEVIRNMKIVACKKWLIDAIYTPEDYIVILGTGEGRSISPEEYSVETIVMHEAPRVPDTYVYYVSIIHITNEEDLLFLKLLYNSLIDTVYQIKDIVNV